MPCLDDLQLDLDTLEKDDRNHSDVLHPDIHQMQQARSATYQLGQITQADDPFFQDYKEPQKPKLF